jgi:hypothetical protein
MGVADLVLIPHEGLVFRDRNSQSGQVRRTLDVHGAALSNFMGLGHGRVRFHNELETTGLELALQVGFNVRRQSADLFSAYIRPADRVRFEGVQRRAARAHRGWG